MEEDKPKTGVRMMTVEEEDTNIRLDKWFYRNVPECGRGQLEKMCRLGQVRVDGKKVKTSLRVEPGQSIRVPPIPGFAGPFIPKPKKELKLTDKQIAEFQALVLHKDPQVIVINKPAGLAVQGGTDTDIHVDAMLDCLTFEAKERPRLVHRLDKDTSGVLVLARTRMAAASLTEAFRERTTKKLYWAVVVGVPDPKEGRIQAPLAKGVMGAGEKMAVDRANGKYAVSDFRVVDSVMRRIAWVALMPRTGRTHQLRVHCVHMGTPIVGDGKYGGAEAFLPEAEGVTIVKQMMLHARAIHIAHPTGGVLKVEAPLPPHMSAIFHDLGFEESLGRNEMLFDIDE